MAQKNSGLSVAHKAVQAYAALHGIGADAFRGDGSVTITVDDQYRVQLRPTEGGRIALASTLMDLGALTPAAADETLMRLATWGAGLLQDHASTLAIDASLDRLVLQQVLSAATDAGTLADDVADFVNVLAFWTRTITAPQRGLAAGG